MHYKRIIYIEVKSIRKNPFLFLYKDKRNVFQSILYEKEEKQKACFVLTIDLYLVDSIYGS